MKELMYDVIRTISKVGEFIISFNYINAILLINLILIFLSLFAIIWIDLAFIYFFVRFIATFFWLIIVLVTIDKIKKI